MSSSFPSWQILTAHTQPFRGARDLAFCLNVPLDSLLVWASSGGSGETARMHRLAWTFTARKGDKYQIRLTRSIWHPWFHFNNALTPESGNILSGCLLLGIIRGFHHVSGCLFNHASPRKNVLMGCALFYVVLLSNISSKSMLGIGLSYSRISTSFYWHNHIQMFSRESYTAFDSTFKLHKSRKRCQLSNVFFLWCRFWRQSDVRLSHIRLKITYHTCK